MGPQEQEGRIEAWAERVRPGGPLPTRQQPNMARHRRRSDNDRSRSHRDSRRDASNRVPQVPRAPRRVHSSGDVAPAARTHHREVQQRPQSARNLSRCSACGIVGCPGVCTNPLSQRFEYRAPMVNQQLDYRSEGRQARGRHSLVASLPSYCPGVPRLHTRDNAGDMWSGPDIVPI